MAGIGSTWTMVLRCPDCQELFTVTGVPEAEVSKTPGQRTCPNCGYVPQEKPFNHVPHTITGLTKERKQS